MNSFLPVERFERILETMSHEEMMKLLSMMEQNHTEKDVLRTLVKEFDLESKGFNSLGFPFKESLPLNWDWVMPELKTSYDIYKHFPVITDCIQNMQEEAYSVMWHNKKYEARFEESSELPEDFHDMMQERLISSLKASGTWIVKAARHTGEICYVVDKSSMSADLTEHCCNETNNSEIVIVAKPTAMEMAMAALATLKTEIPLIYNKGQEQTITVDVYVKELLAKRANIEKVRSDLFAKLRTHSIWDVKSLGERKGFVLTLCAN